MLINPELPYLNDPYYVPDTVVDIGSRVKATLWDIEWLLDLPQGDQKILIDQAYPGLGVASVQMVARNLDGATSFNPPVFGRPKDAYREKVANRAVSMPYRNLMYIGEVGLNCYGISPEDFAQRLVWYFPTPTDGDLKKWSSRARSESEYALLSKGVRIPDVQFGLTSNPRILRVIMGSAQSEFLVGISPEDDRFNVVLTNNGSARNDKGDVQMVKTTLRVDEDPRVALNCFVMAQLAVISAGISLANDYGSGEIDDTVARYPLPLNAPNAVRSAYDMRLHWNNLAQLGMTLEGTDDAQEQVRRRLIQRSLDGEIDTLYVLSGKDSGQIDFQTIQKELNKVGATSRTIKRMLDLTEEEIRVTRRYNGFTEAVITTDRLRDALKKVLPSTV